MHVNLYNKPNQCRLKRSFINKQVDVTVSLINVDSTTSFTFQKLSIVSYFDDMPVLIEMINNCTAQSLESVLPLKECSFSMEAPSTGPAPFHK